MNYGILLLTFISINLDFFFMLLFLVKKYPLREVMAGYLAGNLILLSLSYLIGRVLTVFLPEWLLGLLGFLPIYLALKKDDDSDQIKQHHSAAISVLITYLSVCTGCNLSIFLPILVSESLMHFIETIIFIAILTIIAVWLIKLTSKVPIVSSIMAKHGEKIMKFCYIAIGLYVFWDSGLVTHLLAFF
ncbi:hypothetical protein DLJ48_06175 [Oenococcus sicerae]|uniref:Integral membrane protein n=1 Tax=Oenococcus sicerae TaxID=2203724 RepID=A0AAJ1VLF4_9LACO|nr:cadmium resistance transporter [Oenococcus sicerae]MDN6899438.1 hypothetical protein [Oenococcus sicerae]QAS70137.1 hypothetical protein DLJ48_06175 [Oenococcus sicerae]VDK13709.1 hypothetical protein OAL24_00506 [Oenococcus sicerae]